MPKESKNTPETNNRYVTRAKFRKLCSFDDNDLDAAVLRVDIMRKNVIEAIHGGNKLIDTQEPINAEYIENKRAFTESKILGTNKLLDSEKKRVDLEKSKEDLKLKQIARQQREGELIPTRLANIVIRTHLTTVKQQFYSAAERISNRTVKSLGGNKKDIAKMKGELVAVINQQIGKANEESKKQILSIQNEYRAEQK